MTALNPGPSPLLADWITIPGFLWLVAGCIALACLGILIYNFIQVLREQDDNEPDEPQSDTCQIGDCHEPAWSVYDKHPSGWLWVCRGHDAIVQEWTGAFRRVRSIEAPFDQDDGVA